MISPGSRQVKEAAEGATAGLFYFQAGAGQPLEPGVITIIQTFGDGLNFHPLLHFLVTESGVDEAGIFHRLQNMVIDMVAPN